MVLEYLAGFILSFVFVKILTKAKLFLDVPNHRSTHCNVISRAGGFGFISAFFIASILFDFAFFMQNITIFVAIFIVFLLGIYDDKKGSSAKMKLLFITLASLLVSYGGITIDSIGHYFSYDLSLWYFALPFTLFFIAGFTNALNLVDGLDGLAAGISLVTLSVFSYIGFRFGDALIFSLSMMGIAVLIPYLFFNWFPAKIFMGDSGSLTLGFIISIVAIASLKYIHPVALLYLLAIPILDTLIVFIRRIRLGRSPFAPDKHHMHHILHDFFSNSRDATIFLILAQFIFSLLGYVIARHIAIFQNGVLPIAMIIVFLVIIYMLYMLTFRILQKNGQIEKKCNS